MLKQISPDQQYGLDCTILDRLLSKLLIKKYQISDNTQKISMFKETSLNSYRDYPENQFSYNTTIIPNGIIWYYYSGNHIYVKTTVDSVS